MINRGKIRVAARNNQKIPEGVALDKFGKPTRELLLRHLKEFNYPLEVLEDQVWHGWLIF